MINILIIFLIIANIEIATTSIEAGKFIYDIETNFDKDNNHFTFEYNGNKYSLFYLVIIKADQN